MSALIATLTAPMLVAVVAGDFDDGVAAFDAGNYRTTFQLWKRLAEPGKK